MIVIGCNGCPSDSIINIRIEDGYAIIKCLNCEDELKTKEVRNMKDKRGEE